MSEVIPDWERSDDSHLSTYKGVMRLTVVSAIASIVVLILMALILL
ncbi:MAG: aa3-type cytochrome c oxidase subunit IV [Rhodospirillales bacterium]|nr:aa3-type cytochrome c oxidase subunit IV [Rhodospirillales bacterium]